MLWESHSKKVCFQLRHWLAFIYKSLLGLISPHLCTYMCKNQNQYYLRSHAILDMLVPRVRTELGKKAFNYAAASSWNNAQKDMKLSELIFTGEFKSILKDRENSTLGKHDCS